jgi:hypothetical protein
MRNRPRALQGCSNRYRFGPLGRSCCDLAEGRGPRRATVRGSIRPGDDLAPHAAAAHRLANGRFVQRRPPVPPSTTCARLRPCLRRSNAGPAKQLAEATWWPPAICFGPCRTLVPPARLSTYRFKKPSRSWTPRFARQVLPGGSCSAFRYCLPTSAIGSSSTNCGAPGSAPIRNTGLNVPSTALSWRLACCWNSSPRQREGDRVANPSTRAPPSCHDPH